MSIDATFRRHIENEYDLLRQTCYNIFIKDPMIGLLIAHNKS